MNRKLLTRSVIRPCLPDCVCVVWLPGQDGEPRVGWPRPVRISGNGGGRFCNPTPSLTKPKPISVIHRGHYSVHTYTPQPPAAYSPGWASSSVTMGSPSKAGRKPMFAPGDRFLDCWPVMWELISSDYYELLGQTPTRVAKQEKQKKEEES